MYDVKNSLYEAYEKDEFEKLTEEIILASAKDEASSLEEKLAASKEVEQFYQSKVNDIAPFIIELKERSNELNELRDAAEEKAKESELDPKNQELKEEALMLIEEYSAVVEEITQRIEKKLRAGFTKLLESQQFDHQTLFDTLKEYRSQLKEEITKQKEIPLNMLDQLIQRYCFAFIFLLYATNCVTSGRLKLRLFCEKQPVSRFPRSG